MSRKKPKGLSGISREDLLAHIQHYAQRRELWAQEGNVSLPLHAGRLVILVSTGRALPGEYGLFVGEAERLKDEREASREYGEVVIVKEATHEDMDALLRDRDVAAFELVAHGSFGRGWMSNMRYGRTDYTWLDAAAAATHLKRQVRQDMCGHLPVTDPISVALGAMVVENISDVLAAVGNRIPVPDGQSRDHLFSAPYQDGTDLVGQIIAVNGLHNGIVNEVNSAGRVIHTEDAR